MDMGPELFHDLLYIAKLLGRQVSIVQQPIVFFTIFMAGIEPGEPLISVSNGPVIVSKPHEEIMAQKVLQPPPLGQLRVGHQGAAGAVAQIGHRAVKGALYLVVPVHAERWRCWTPCKTATSSNTPYWAGKSS